MRRILPESESEKSWMKWFFRFAIFWMLPCISDGPDVTCQDSQNKNPNSMWLLRQWGTKTQWRGGKAGAPPLPACLRYTNLQFLWSHAGDSTCVCVEECGESVWVWETEPLLPSQPSASAPSLHLQSCCARSRRTEVCVVFLKGRGGGVGVVRMMMRWKGPGEEETQECPFPLSPFSFSLLLSLPLSLSVTWCVFAVCERERVKQVGYASADWTVNLQEEAALSRLRYVTQLSSHAFPEYPRHVGDLWLSERRDAEGGRKWLKGQRILSSNHTLR